MAERVPVRRDQNVPAAQEGEVLPAWRGPASIFPDIDTVFDRMVRNFFDLPRRTDLWGGGFTPAVDIEETADAYIFDIDLPGVRREDISIEAGHNELHVSGEVNEKDRTGTMRHRTRRTGNVQLPGRASGRHGSGRDHRDIRRRCPDGDRSPFGGIEAPPYQHHVAMVRWRS